jgi:hypothetical protein|tara:strand:- start:272 stop:607 length:336 start_codon:yes stop_codon:yes gene_type:complete
MTASIFVGGKPIDGKLILNDDWRKVRNVFTCALRLRSIRFLRVRSNLEEGSERTTSSRNFCPLDGLPSFFRKREREDQNLTNPFFFFFLLLVIKGWRKKEETTGRQRVAVG